VCLGRIHAFGSQLNVLLKLREPGNTKRL